MESKSGSETPKLENPRVGHHGWRFEVTLTSYAMFLWMYFKYQENREDVLVWSVWKIEQMSQIGTTMSSSAAKTSKPFHTPALDPERKPQIPRLYFKDFPMVMGETLKRISYGKLYSTWPWGCE